MQGHYDQPIYTMWTAWGNDPEIVGEQMALEKGSAHGIHAPMLTGEKLYFAADFPEGFDTAGYIEMSDAFMQYTANFMRTGDPNGEGLVQWDTVGAKGYQQLVMDADKDKANIYMSDATISYDDVLKQIEEDTTVSAESKKAIIETVLNGRWFSAGLDEHFGNKSLWVE